MTSAPTRNIPVSVPATNPASNPVPGRPQTPPTIAGSIPSGRAVARRLLQGTPGRMRLLAVIGVLAALVVGALSANALLGSKAAAERAANNTAQVVRVQSIHVDLLRADALATNAFLVGGLESPAARAQYDAAMARVATTLAEAAAAQPPDGKALGVLAEHVQSYVALVEQARSNNRLGLQIGAQYLTEASDGLRADAIPVVTAIVEANEGRSGAEFDRANARIQLVGGVLAIIVLAFIAIWLARRTHRYLNPSLLAGIALLIVGLFVAASTISTIALTTRQVANGDYRQAVTLAQMGTAANDARANESLTLVKRGSGVKYETAWKANDKVVLDTLGKVDGASAISTSWREYTAAHTEIRSLDDGGQWDMAVSQATTAASGATAAFDEFDKGVTSKRDTASTAAVSQLTGLGGSAPIYAALIAIAALIAAWLIVRGIGQRIQEYR